MYYFAEKPSFILSKFPLNISKYFFQSIDPYEFSIIISEFV